MKALSLFLLVLLAAVPSRAQADLYVSPLGNDANTGRDLASAKLTMFGALTSLPGGSAKSLLSGSGTVHVAAGLPPMYSFVWLMDPHDPNYAHPPVGWLRCNGCSTNVIGMPNTTAGPNGHRPTVSISAGGYGNNNQPAIWLSGTQLAHYFSNLAFSYTGRSVVIGECSNKARSGCGVSGVGFDNVSSQIGNKPTSGPCTDITGGAFWLWVRDCGW